MMSGVDLLFSWTSKKKEAGWTKKRAEGTAKREEGGTLPKKEGLGQRKKKIEFGGGETQQVGKGFHVGEFGQRGKKKKRDWRS